jgi:hypothetical protein
MVDTFRRYILFHDKRHPRDMSTLEVEAFLTPLTQQVRCPPGLAALL